MKAGLIPTKWFIILTQARYTHRDTILFPRYPGTYVFQIK